jgi:hypothetical protein
MLLQCEICQTKVSEIAKVPCGYYFEKEDGKPLLFIMPNDETAYRDICLSCLSKI